MTRHLAAAAVGTAALALGIAAGTQLGGTSTPTVLTPTVAACEDWAINLTRGECHAAGAIRFVALYNLQGAAQWCRWRDANPGEWARLRQMAAMGQPPERIVTWLGNAIRNVLEAYQATGAPPFEIAPNTAPNVCRTPLATPKVSATRVDETTATVTIAP